MSSRRRLLRVALALVSSLSLLALPVASAEAAPKVPKKFVIAGSGAGHGVGMAQYGAYQLARDGLTAEQILQHYYPGTSIGTAVNNPRTVKVQVLGPPADGRKSATVTVKSGGFTVTAGARKFTSIKAGTIRLTLSGRQVTATIKKTKLKAARVIITPTGNAVATVTGAQGSYRDGNLQATVIRAKLNVVNQVAMNTDYLYGIDEMPASWGNAGGAEALRAQAIAARSYVIGQILNHLPAAQRPDAAGMPSCDCHVYDDERSQNYTGWKKAGKSANQPWRKAVDDTISDAGVQVVWAAPGVIAETLYFASTGRGGGTAANADVFGTSALPYLISISDPYSASAPGNPHLSWKRTLTQAKIAKIFGLTKVVSVTVTATYEGGLVKSLTAKTASGKTKTVTKTSRSWASLLGLPAPWLTSITGK